MRLHQPQRNWTWLRNWQTLIGAVVGFVALAMTSYVSGCQQRQLLAAQNKEQTEERLRSANSVRAVFLVEMTQIGITCSHAAATLSANSSAMVAFPFSPWDRTYDRFMGRVIELYPFEVAEILDMNESYRDIRADMQGNKNFRFVNDGFEVTNPAAKMQVAGLLKGCSISANQAANGLTNFVYPPGQP